MENLVKWITFYYLTVFESLSLWRSNHYPLLVVIFGWSARCLMSHVSLLVLCIIVVSHSVFIMYKSCKTIEILAQVLTTTLLGQWPKQVTLPEALGVFICVPVSHHDWNTPTSVRERSVPVSLLLLLLLDCLFCALPVPYFLFSFFSFKSFSCVTFVIIIMIRVVHRFKADFLPNSSAIFRVVKLYSHDPFSMIIVSLNKSSNLLKLKNFPFLYFILFSVFQIYLYYSLSVSLFFLYSLSYLKFIYIFSLASLFSF